jgi:hypothetical protein
MTIGRGNGKTEVDPKRNPWGAIPDPPAKRKKRRNRPGFVIKDNTFYNTPLTTQNEPETQNSDDQESSW